MSLEMHASENPTLEALEPDPTLFCTAFKKNRFYLFSRRGPGDERDVFNEKPSKEDVIAATDETGHHKVPSIAVTCAISKCDVIYLILKLAR
jgi:peptidylprolyl isomerase domain and WD repeat-containing protein 1